MNAIALRSGSLVLALTVLLSPMSAFAEESKDAPLLPQEAALDNSKPPEPTPDPITDPNVTNTTKMLNGSITKLDRADQGDPSAGTIRIESKGPLTIKINGANMDLQKAAGLFKLLIGGGSPFIQLNSRTPQMSSEQFRKLEYGVIGLDAVLQLDGTSGPVVRHLYPSCPAELAGMQPGDRIVQAQDHIFKPGEGQRVLWNIVGGKAGTPLDVTVLRQGQPITFHMVRMNIEDIQNERIRRMYENLLSALGPPSYQAGNTAGTTFGATPQGTEDGDDDEEL